MSSPQIPSFIVLSEVGVSSEDALRALTYLGLADEGDTESSASSESGPRAHVTVIVPLDTERSLVAQVIDSLGLADLRGAWEALAQRMGARESPGAESRDPAALARERLVQAQDAFAAVGCTTQGRVSADDPTDAVREALTEDVQATVVVFSDPQILEETFARDWAHRVEDRLGATVLHLYPGTGTIGTA